MDSKGCSLSFSGDKAGMPGPVFFPAFSNFAAWRLRVRPFLVFSFPSTNFFNVHFSLCAMGSFIFPREAAKSRRKGDR